MDASRSCLGAVATRWRPFASFCSPSVGQCFVSIFQVSALLRENSGLTTTMQVLYKQLLRKGTICTREPAELVRGREYMHKFVRAFLWFVNRARCPGLEHVQTSVALIGDWDDLRVSSGRHRHRGLLFVCYTGRKNSIVKPASHCALRNKFASILLFVWLHLYSSDFVWLP